MSKQGDLAIEKALKNIWGTYDIVESKGFPTIYDLSEEQQIPAYCNFNNFNVYHEWFECHFDSKLFFIGLEMCSYEKPDKPEIWVCAYSPDCSFYNKTDNEANANYNKLEKLVAKINNDVQLYSEYKIEIGKIIYCDDNGSTIGVSIGKHIFTHDNLESHLKKIYNDAQSIFGYIIYNLL